MRRERKGRKWTANVREKGEREREWSFFTFFSPISPKRVPICISSVRPFNQPHGFPPLSLSAMIMKKEKKKKSKIGHISFSNFFFQKNLLESMMLQKYLLTTIEFSDISFSLSFSDLSLIYFSLFLCVVSLVVVSKCFLSPPSSIFQVSLSLSLSLSLLVSSLLSPSPSLSLCLFL